MNKSDLLTLMENPAGLNKHQIGNLRSIATDFPYYQGIQMLITKALANEKHYLLDGQLKKTALTIPDRNVLFRYMHDMGSPLSKPTEPGHYLRTETGSIPLGIHSPPEPPPLTAEGPLREKEVEPDRSAPADQHVEQPAAETLLPAIDALQPLEVDKSIGEELATEINDIFPLDEDLRAEPPAEEETIQSKGNQLTPEPEVPNEITAPPEKIELNELHSFAEWLKLARGEKPIEEIDPRGSPGEKMEHAGPLHKEVVDPNPPQPPPPVVLKDHGARSNVNQFESILDKFIRENPGISRPKGEFFNPSHIARQSNEEDENLVTETLAGIYRKQGHYKKAIRAYEKLCLIYPHKMAYFADLIQKIKQESKD